MLENGALSLSTCPMSIQVGPIIQEQKVVDTSHLVAVLSMVWYTRV